MSSTLRATRRVSLPARLGGRSGRLLAAVGSGAMLAAALSLHPIWWLAWVAPVPLLIAVLRAGPVEAVLLAALAGVLQALPGFDYYLDFGGPPVVALALTLDALLWLGVLLPARFVVRRSRHWLVPLVYPAAWAGVDLLLAVLSPHGTFGSLAYSQMAALPVIQVASLAGTSGVVFLMSVPAALIASATWRPLPERAWLAFGIPVAVLAGSLAFGVVRLESPPAQDTVQVGLLTMDPPPGSAAPDGLDPIWGEYLHGARQAAARGARLIVSTEGLDLVDGPRARQLAARLGATASELHVWLLAAVVTREGSVVHNRAWVFGPSGARVADYAKHYPVPGLEAEVTPGQSYAVFPLGASVLGVAICKDLDFPALARHYAAAGVAALVVPAGDFGADAWMHARMAVLRGVEGGFSVIRSASDGLASVSDRYGRVSAEAPSAPPPGRVLVAPAALDAGAATPYARVGDTFGVVCGSAVLVAMLLLVPRRRRTA